MFEGLAAVERALADRGIRLAVKPMPPNEAALQFAPYAALMVTDRGYLEIQRVWRRKVARKSPCSVIQVETDAVVPVDRASQKEEYAAATLRPKILRQLERFLTPLRRTRLKRPSLDFDLSVPGRYPLDRDALDLTDVEALARKFRIDRSVGAAPGFRGGDTRSGATTAAFPPGAVRGVSPGPERSRDGSVLGFKSLSAFRADLTPLHRP